MRCTALNQQCKEVKLVNKDGKSWTASFGFSESDGAYYISRGWRKFCRDNRCTNGDLFVFNVVGDGTTTPLLCVCPERKECTELLIKHFSRIDGKSSHLTCLCCLYLQCYYFASALTCVLFFYRYHCFYLTKLDGSFAVFPLYHLNLFPFVSLATYQLMSFDL